MPTNILLLVAHPTLSESKANAALLNAAKELPNVTAIDLYATPFTLDNYLEPVRQADVLVMQFPFWWGGSPAKLKEWIDTFFITFLENPGLKGKRLLVATTCGSPAEAYRPGGYDQFNVDEILRPFQFTAIYAGLTYLSPFVIYGMGSDDAAARIEAGAKAYKELLAGL